MRPLNAIAMMLGAAAVIMLSTRGCSMATGPGVYGASFGGGAVGGAGGFGGGGTGGAGGSTASGSGGAGSGPQPNAIPGDTRKPGDSGSRTNGAPPQNASGAAANVAEQPGTGAKGGAA